eukprot:TRINITY_DN7853_c0_g1_i1.p1 TRINITY_DN7853_c0_g1~~TRINITY_DN7853_c0_g1_i1.p1  ORF type:complete len:189 (-),score=35.63 TRINITY_DN7853_c0_g1_i1:198-764(-)
MIESVISQQVLEEIVETVETTTKNARDSLHVQLVRTYSSSLHIDTINEAMDKVQEVTDHNLLFWKTVWMDYIIKVLLSENGRLHLNKIEEFPEIKEWGDGSLLEEVESLRNQIIVKRERIQLLDKKIEETRSTNNKLGNLLEEIESNSDVFDGTLESQYRENLIDLNENLAQLKEMNILPQNYNGEFE